MARRHPSGDLGSQPATELLEQLDELVARQHQLELRQLAFATQLLHRRAEHPREVDGTHHPVEVVPLAVLLVGSIPAKASTACCAKNAICASSPCCIACSNALDS